MSITVSLPPETERKLREQAARRGKEVSEYIRAILVSVVEGIEGLTPSAQDAASIHAGMTFDEILAPMRQGFAESGMTEEEILRFFEEVREEVWQEKHRQGALTSSLRSRMFSHALKRVANFPL